MHIHTVKKGESIYDIARAYDVSPSKTVENNGLENKNELSVGRELLILRPTRTYTVRRGDTLSGIAMRFGIRLRDLIIANPSHIGNDKLSVGEILTVKTPERIYGTGVSNGYYYKGCPLAALEGALPFLTYVTVASVISDKGELKWVFNDTAVVKRIKESGRIPIVRIYDISDGSAYLDPSRREELISSMISSAKEGGYEGIALCAFSAQESDPRAFGEFIMELRKRMIGCDLVLFTEIDESSSCLCADLADGSVLTYDKLAYENIPSFDEGERRVMSDFAARCESSKVFIDIPSLAYDGNRYMSYSEAMRLCYNKGGEIVTDGKTLISSFEYRDGKSKRVVRFESMKSIEAKLRTMSDLGFMGISFDIMRTPTSTLMMFATLYKILARERCETHLGGIDPTDIGGTALIC